MPADIASALIDEVLEAVQSHVTDPREDRDLVKGRLTSIDTRLGLVHTDMARQSDRLDKLERRIGRVETRLKIGG
ncbi:MAG: hypothetical protein FJX61_05290 [Alphaproteobacteria bacterium]|nr:hypothetical protein [Alphaproteobacteria bacterium]